MDGEFLLIAHRLFNSRNGNLLIQHRARIDERLKLPCSHHASTWAVEMSAIDSFLQERTDFNALVEVRP